MIAAPTVAPVTEASADETPDRDPAPAAREIDAVLYDFGNVLVGWDPYGAYEWSTRITVRGFNQNRMGFTLDGDAGPAPAHRANSPGGAA